MLSLTVLDDKLWFPPPSAAMEDGLLAIGGDLRVERLLLAYQKGIFPWYDGDVPLWWNPNPRFVLFPYKLKVSKSMQQVLRQQKFTFKINTAFQQVMKQCQQTPRKDQDGTWINEDVIEAYTELHHLGHAHSAEAWLGNELVGGLYGIRLGGVFFGESMFSTQSNASKFAFIHWVQYLQKQGVALIDCQVHTSHLESLGAEMIDRADFLDQLQKLI